MSDQEQQISVKYQQLLEIFYHKVSHDVEKLYVKGEHITRQNIILITDLLMKEAGKLKTLIGVEKKTLVMTTLNKMMDDNLNYLKAQAEKFDKAHQKEWERLQKFVDQNIDPTIDQLFALAPKVYGKVTSNKWWTCHRA